MDNAFFSSDGKGGRRRRVVITGVGAVTPLGIGVKEYWQGLVQGRSGIGPLTLFDASDLSCQVAGEVKGFDPRDFLGTKQARHTARFTQFAVAAARMALEDAQLDLSQEDPNRIGVFLGNGIGGLPETQEEIQVLLSKGGMRVTPFFMPMILANMAAGQVAITFQLKGYISTVITACAAGTQAIGEAAEVIRRGRAGGLWHLRRRLSRGATRQRWGCPRHALGSGGCRTGTERR